MKIRTGNSEFWTRRGICGWMLGVVVLVSTASAQAQIPAAPDVEAQIASLRASGDLLGFHTDPSLPVPIGRFHWQGIARHPDPDVPFLYATYSNPCNDGGGVLAIIEIASADPVDYRLRSNRLAPQSAAVTPPRQTDRVVGYLRYPSHYHPGPVQTAGKYLAVSLESDEDCSGSNETRIYDISDPRSPSLARTFSATGTLGFTRLSTGQYLIAYASSYVNFILTRGTSITSPLSFGVWDVADLIGGEWPGCGEGSYCPQALSLVQQAGTDPLHNIYMFPMRNTHGAGTGTDVLDIYRVELTPTGSESFDVTVYDRGEKHFPTDASGNFSAGSSVWIAPSGDLIVYKMPHYNVGPADPEPTVPFVEHSTFRGSWSGTDDFSCMAHLQLYTEKDLNDATLLDYSAGVDAVDELLENYRRLSLVDPMGLMGDSVSSVAWTLPVGCTARLWQNPDWGGHYLDLPGTGAPEWYSDLSQITWTDAPGSPNNKISSIEWLGNCPSRRLLLPPGPAADIAQVLPLMLPGGPCSLLQLETGYYPGALYVDQEVRFEAFGGPIVIGD
jgi:hypothetical protein